MSGRARSSLFERLSESAFRDLMSDRPVSTAARLPPVILLEKCPVCSQWLTQGAKAMGQCRSCESWIGVLVRQITH